VCRLRSGKEAVRRYHGPGSIPVRGSGATALFVYPKESDASVVNFLRGLALVWKLVGGFATLAIAVFVVLGAARFQFRAEAGVYSFSFGRHLPATGVARDPAKQIESVRAEVAGLESRSLAERAKWLQQLRAEIEELHRDDRHRQRHWDAALLRLESRLNGRIEAKVSSQLECKSQSTALCRPRNASDGRTSNSPAPAWNSWPLVAT